jgi:hypothetical protein
VPDDRPSIFFRHAVRDGERIESLKMNGLNEEPAGPSGDFN